MIAVLGRAAGQHGPGEQRRRVGQGDPHPGADAERLGVVAAEIEWIERRGADGDPEQVEHGADRDGDDRPGDHGRPGHERMQRVGFIGGGLDVGHGVCLLRGRRCASSQATTFGEPDRSPGR